MTTPPALGKKIVEKMKLLLLSALLLLSNYPLHLQGAGEESTESAAESSQSGCSAPHNTLYAIIYQDLFREFQENLTIYVNCLSFDEAGALRSGIISGVNETSDGGRRLNLRCAQGAIVATESEEMPIAMNMSSTACVSCTDQATDVCNQPCNGICERCYNTTDSCTRCIACNSNELEGCSPKEESSSSLGIEQYCGPECTATGKETNPSLFNFCECPHGYYPELVSYPPAEEEEEGEIPEVCSPDPELEDFICVKNCSTSRPGFYPNEELHEICFACGLEYCLLCDGEKKECKQCLEHTVLFEHECYACPLALVAKVAIEQEEELEEEEAAARLNQIELAVSLPILSVLVILFFVGMSVFTHFRYPHINPAGHKRHRTNPEDFDVAVANPSADALEPLDDGPPPEIWRARPTVRLR